jgi:hypothetical protein
MKKQKLCRGCYNEKMRARPPVIATRLHRLRMQPRNCPCGSVFTEMHILSERKVVWLCRRCADPQKSNIREN